MARKLSLCNQAAPTGTLGKTLRWVEEHPVDALRQALLTIPTGVFIMIPTALFVWRYQDEGAAQLVNFSRRTLKVEPDRRPSWGHASARVEPRDHAQVPESDPMTEWKTLLSDGVERSAQIGMRTRPTHSAAFRGRAIEWRQLGLLLDRVSTGESAALIVRGEAGIGKTALLDHCSGQAAGFRIVRISGMQSEMELPFAGLHQLCAPMFAEVECLPEPQQNALRVAFGLMSGDAPDRFLVAWRRSACWLRWR